MHRFRKQSLLKEVWKGGRVVDYSGLENRRAERHRGFESLPFRGKNKKVIIFDHLFYLSPHKLFYIVTQRKQSAEGNDLPLEPLDYYLHAFHKRHNKGSCPLPKGLEYFPERTGVLCPKDKSTPPKGLDGPDPKIPE